MKIINNVFTLITLLTIINFNSIQSQQLKHFTAESKFGPSFIGYVPNQFLIKLNPSLFRLIKETLLNNGRMGIPYIDKINEKYNVDEIIQKFPDAEIINYKNKLIDLKNWLRVTFKKNIDIQSVVNEYSTLTGIISAEPIEIHTVDIVPPNDPSFSLEWHLNQVNDADIDALEAWDINTGNNEIIVAILDTGVRYFHKDLGGINASLNNPQNSVGNMWINQLEKVGSPGFDDDYNGKIDDWIGWDFVSNVNFGLISPYSKITGEDYDTPDNDPRDFNGHGTHCAGIVAAINNNGYGVSSMVGGWNNGSQLLNGNGVKIMPLRIGYSANYFDVLRLSTYEVGLVNLEFAASALFYAANNGVKIASCSWSSSNNSMLADAIDYFLANGGLIFKSAGNNNDENSDFMTARNDIITVASTNENDLKSSFSSYGSFVDISAPGSNILSTYHVHNDPANDYIATLSGTSMATPLVASVAALIWSKNPTWNPSQIKQKLLESIDNIYSLPGNSAYLNKLGSGRVNAYKALTDNSIQLKIFLEGSYVGLSSMRTTISTLADFPKSQPFNVSPWFYNGSESIKSVPPNLVDWVLVELRDALSNSIFTRPALLLSNGDIKDLDGRSAPQFPVSKGNYYVLVHHRNHLTIMSKNQLTIN